MNNATPHRIKDTTAIAFETLDSVMAHWQADVSGVVWN